MAVAVALVAVLAAGLWLGGHPQVLPEPLRDAFVTEPSALTAEAAAAKARKSDAARKERRKHGRTR